MVPLTLEAAQAFAQLLTSNEALAAELARITDPASGIPAIDSSRVYLSSANAEIADRQAQFAYPRVSVFSTRVKNKQVEKFRSLSGSVAVTAEISVTAPLVAQAEGWTHYYLEAITNILRRNFGDWGNGLLFSGIYDVEVRPVRVAASGFAQVAAITCELMVSRG